MLLSKFYLFTKKEVPHDTESISHKLMLRSGMVKMAASGIYTWLPLGLRVLQKVEAIVRKELNNVGAMELLMPSIHPAKLWKETNRWDNYGPTLLKIKDRTKRDYCYGPTHEEVVTDVFRQDISSYKKLPLIVYQIQTKFRDELRPRYGIIRAREFLMKDAYSFHSNDQSLDETYNIMHDSYLNIFKAMGLEVQAAIADTGNIGGSKSHEFQIIAESGEDRICYSSESNYAANVECAPVLQREKDTSKKEEQKPLEKISTKKAATIDEILKTLDVSSKSLISSHIAKTNEDEFIVFLTRSDHTLNNVKAEKIATVNQPITFLSNNEIKKVFNISSLYLSPINTQFKIIADNDLQGIQNFAIGANEDGFYCNNVNWDRDLQNVEFHDIRNVEINDLSPDGKGVLKIKKGIEVGHIFQLGKIYTEKMKVSILNEQGKSIHPVMGCFGLGLSRIVAAAIEQNHDDRGIVWPSPISPFSVILIPINMHKSKELEEKVHSIYKNLTKNHNVDVLLDDRKKNPGMKFADADLIGITHRIVLSDKLLANNKFEYKRRDKQDSENLSLDNIDDFIVNLA